MSWADTGTSIALIPSYIALWMATTELPKSILGYGILRSTTWFPFGIVPSGSVPGPSFYRHSPLLPLRSCTTVVTCGET